jgi:aerobic-type carbon monoxide dehydrogenase small subunit (CoxS/CutS family)
MMGGEAVASCKLSAKECSGRTIVTIEGIAKGGDLHPVQKAFMEEDAMQCGTCTGGMVISAVVLLAKNPRPTEQEIRRALAPHLCRCGIYCRAIRAVKRACR